MKRNKENNRYIDCIFKYSKYYSLLNNFDDIMEGILEKANRESNIRQPLVGNNGNYMKKRMCLSDDYEVIEY